MLFCSVCCMLAASRDEINFIYKLSVVTIAPLGRHYSSKFRRAPVWLVRRRFARCRMTSIVREAASVLAVTSPMTSSMTSPITYRSVSARRRTERPSRRRPPDYDWFFLYTVAKQMWSTECCKFARRSLVINKSGRVAYRPAFFVTSGESNNLTTVLLT